MRNPILVTASHTEPILADGFSAALERLATALYVGVRHQGLTPEGVARVRVLPPRRPTQTLPFLVGSLLARPADLPDPVDPWADDYEDPESLVHVEPTA